ncbi:MAG: hypothetical protein M0R80_04280 [Proteobacteria bacterium]|jgi:hypothetical protein|nr:hypothetical protein [Pseudomonadota bacterium]
MKYTNALKDILEDSMHKHLKIVTKVGTIHDGFLQSYGEFQIIISNNTTSLINVKDIAVIEMLNCSLSSYERHWDRETWPDGIPGTP